MGKISIFIILIFVSCQKSPSTKQTMIYKKLPASEAAKIASNHKIYEAKVLPSTVDLSEGNENLLENSSQDENENLRKELQKQNERIEKLQRENASLRMKQSQKTKTQKTKTQKTKTQKTKTQKQKTQNSSKHKPASRRKITSVKHNSLEEHKSTSIETAKNDVPESKTTSEKDTIKKTQKNKADEQLTITAEPTTNKTGDRKEDKNNAHTENEIQRVSYTIKKHILRIISLPENRETEAEDIVLFLKVQDIEATHHVLGKYRVVDIVNTPEFGTPKAREFQKKIHKLPYQGKLQFKDAYYTIRK